MSHFTWYDLFGVSHHYTFVAANIFATVLVVILSFAAKLALGTGEAAIAPAAGFSVKGLCEAVVEFIDSLGKMVLGDHARHLLPLFGSVFFFILINNLIGLLPGMTAATGNINTALAVGVFSFVTYNYLGLKHGGWHYLAHFAGPSIWLAPLLIPIELVSHSIRPFSLALRLSINMTADHTVLGTFLELTKLIVPIIFYGMGTFVSFVQALVFTMLSMVYVVMATADDH